MTEFERFNLEYALSEMDRYYEQMQGCTSTAGRKYNAQHMLDIMEEVTEVRTYWEYNEAATRWEKRFTKVSHKIEISSKPEAKPDESAGLYLVGNTYFDPFTDDKYFWIKTGQASDFEKRMKQYATHNPMLWKADFITIADKYERDFAEAKCHAALKAISIGVADNTKEWFRVSREDYLKICSEGFKWFGLV